MRTKFAVAVMALAMTGAACASRTYENSNNTMATASPMADTASTPLDSASPTANPMASASPAAPLAAEDKKFVMEAAQGGKMEVQLGQLAAQNAASDDVKQFGQRMVDEHSKANQDLMQLASQHNVTPPDSLSAEGQKTYDQLLKLTGAAFDKAYMSHMVKDHVKDVAEFEKMSNRASNADVKTFASTTLPTLREHLQMARDVAKKVGAK